MTRRCSHQNIPSPLENVCLHGDGFLSGTLVTVLKGPDAATYTKKELASVDRRWAPACGKEKEGNVYFLSV